ncbi:trafficking protein particle complex subunit 2-like protein [Striga asiatica]|uniref:Trafficking protein particle complex subunit 2-like protein n=1 Tax=Striga asiatica TaxID=4170 RepID=A0A5A7PPR3_STRAF|nr:trafficking protein particle complex subunit 2-like protein [Striga asiatica]
MTRSSSITLFTVRSTSSKKVVRLLDHYQGEVILVTTDLDVRDVDVRNFFRKFHAAYVDAVMNPFHIPEILGFRQSIYSGIASEWFTPRFGFDVGCYTVSNIIEEVT